jgi:hypothetical protein
VDAIFRGDCTHSRCRPRRASIVLSTAKLRHQMNHEDDYSAGRSDLRGRYANYFEVGQNQAEFLIDFAQFYTAGERPAFHTRIVTSPLYVKALTRLLNDAVTHYEERFGPIEDA